MKLLKYYILFFASACQPIPQGRAPASPQVLSYVQKYLPFSGVLKKTGNFIYVDLENDYIHKLIPLIEEAGFQSPPYFKSDRSAGAHISVIYPREVGTFNLDLLEEMGQEIQFRILGCKVIHPVRWKGVDSLYLIEVDSPKLDEIREKYGFKEKEFNFHITIGIKRKAGTRQI